MSDPDGGREMRVWSRQGRAAVQVHHPELAAIIEYYQFTGTQSRQPRPKNEAPRSTGWWLCLTPQHVEVNHLCASSTACGTESDKRCFQVDQLCNVGQGQVELWIREQRAGRKGRVVDRVDHEGVQLVLVVTVRLSGGVCRRPDIARGRKVINRRLLTWQVDLGSHADPFVKEDVVESRLRVSVTLSDDNSRAGSPTRLQRWPTLLQASETQGWRRGRTSGVCRRAARASRPRCIALGSCGAS